MNLIAVILKILLVNTLYYPQQIGGAEKSVQALAEALVGKGHQVRVVTLDKEEVEDEVNGVRVHRLKLQNIYWPFGAKVSIFQKMIWHWKDNYNQEYDSKWKQIFEEFQPDVLHTHNLGGFSVRVWELAETYKIPIFHTLRDYYLMSTSTTNLENEKFTDSFFSPKRKETSRFVNAVSGISKFILNAHLKTSYFTNAESKVIFNGFELKFSEKKSSAHPGLRFGFIGQVKEHKGIYLLLNVFEKLAFPDVKLIVAGNASDELIAQYKNKKTIDFKGFVQPDDFYNEIDILVVPSLWHEPFGRVVMEALGRKIPVLGSKMGGIPELLSNNQEFLFEPNEESLSTLINRLIENPDILKKFLFDAQFLNNFQLDIVVEQYESVYKSLTLPADEN